MAGSKVTFVYRNWRGEIGERTVIPERIEFGTSPYHNGHQWFLHAWCCDKDARRTFAIEDILSPIRHVELVDNVPSAPPRGDA